MPLEPVVGRALAVLLQHPGLPHRVVEYAIGSIADNYRSELFLTFALIPDTRALGGVKVAAIGPMRT